MSRKMNNMAVSPIVATLVLIVVAVVGAVAVGTIMGTFSGQVSKQANAGQAGSASQTELLTAGSTTVYPASLQIAKLYMEQNPGIKITVQPGGSGAGVAATGAGTVDIGASSDLSKITSANSAHPDWNLEWTQIGGSGIVVVGGTGVSQANVTAADLKAAFNNNNPVLPISVTGVTEIVTRSDASGTADTFYKALGYSGQLTPGSTSNTNNVNVVSVSGNEGVVAEVQAHPGALGFLDMGYAFPALGTVNASAIIIEGIDDTGASHLKTPGGASDSAWLGIPTGGTSGTIQKAVKDLLTSVANPPDIKSGDYPLVRGLYYFTKGNPTPIEQAYIQFAASPGACINTAGTEGMHVAGVFCNADVA